MSTRRSFFRKTGKALGTFSLTALAAKSASAGVADALAELNTLTPEAAATDDDL